MELYIIICCTLLQFGTSLDFTYHNNTEMQHFLTKIVEDHPNIASKYNIGSSVEGKQLNVVVLGSPPEDSVPLRPNVNLIGNMHGDETAGREILLHLIDYIVTEFDRNDTIKTLLQTTRLHILPSLNPDGFENVLHDPIPVCSRDTAKWRRNSNDFDLNRNFPDYFEVNTAERQPETQAVMDWLKETQFVLSANLHGGALLFNYPYDNYIKGSIIKVPKENKCDDDDIYRDMGKTYSFAHPRMFQNIRHCENKTFSFKDGITNGAQWYPIIGGLQDYSYIFAGCVAVTIEVACCYVPVTEDLPTYWTENKDPLIRFVQGVHTAQFSFSKGSKVGCYLKMENQSNQQTFQS